MLVFVRLMVRVVLRACLYKTGDESLKGLLRIGSDSGIVCACEEPNEHFVHLGFSSGVGEVSQNAVTLSMEKMASSD